MAEIPKPGKSYSKIDQHIKKVWEQKKDRNRVQTVDDQTNLLRDKCVVF